MKNIFWVALVLAAANFCQDATAGVLVGEESKAFYALLEKSGHKPVNDILSFSQIETCSIRLHVDPPGHSPVYLCLTWDSSTSMRSNDLVGDEAKSLTNLLISADACMAGDSSWQSYSVRNVLCTKIDDGYGSVICTFDSGMLVTPPRGGTETWKSCD